MAARHSINRPPRPDLLQACLQVAQTALSRATRHTSDPATRHQLELAQARLRAVPGQHPAPAPSPRPTRFRRRGPR